MKVLTVTSLYPNSGNRKHGIFIHHRIKQIRNRHPDIDVKVIAPVPWFPFKSKIFGSYARVSSVPSHEVIDGIEVFHPRYLVVPKIGMHLTPHTLAYAIDKTIQSILATGDQIDLIDGHYYYPDGVAIERIASKHNIPFTCTARGTDINYIPQSFPLARKRIQHVFANAKRNMAVCQALLDCMTDELGADKSTAVVARNGVDLELFQFADKEQHDHQKALLGAAQQYVILSVGHLIERKGHHIVIEALQSLENAELWILGVGPMRQALEDQAKQLGVEERVRFLGEMPQSEMIQYYQAADCMVLASSREGWANVLLESMACGTPVVATRLWGTPEVMPAEDQDFLVERDAKALSTALNKRLQQNPSRLSVRAHAEKFSWEATSSLLMKTWKECANSE